MKAGRYLPLTALLAAMSLAGVGCQNGFSTADSRLTSDTLSTGSKTDDAALGLDRLNMQTAAMEESIVLSLEQIDSVANSSAFRFDFNTISAVLLGDMEGKLKDVVDQLVDRLGSTRSVVDKARGKINERLAQLDPKNPNHHLAIIGLENLLDRLDILDDKIDVALDRVRSKAQSLIVKIDSVVKEARKNPLVNIAITLLLSRFQGNVGGIVGELLKLIGPAV